MTTPDFATLADWIDGRLPPARAASVAAAVSGADPSVERTLAWLRSFADVAAAVKLHQPPPSVGRTLHDAFQSWRHDNVALHDEIGRWDLEVLFDSRRDLARSGVRSALPADVGEVVHLAFGSPAADLVVDVRTLGGGQVRLDGQVMPTSPVDLRTFTVIVSGPDGTSRRGQLDELGRFRFDHLPDSVTELWVHGFRLEIRAPLDLRAASE